MLKSVLMAAVCALALAVPALASGSVTQIINGRTVTFETSPIIMQHQVMVPLQATYTNLGGTVDFDPDTQSYVLRRANQVARISLGSRQATLNGEAITLAVAPTRMGSEILVPMDFACEATGTDLTYVPAALDDDSVILGAATTVIVPTTVLPAHPLGVYSLSPLGGSAVGALFYLEGSTEPYATVHVTEVRTGEGLGNYYHHIAPQDFFANADDLGHFSVQVDASRFASGTPLTMHVRARDASGFEGPVTTIDLVKR